MRPPDRLRVGLNLVFLTPGEQGGMEIYARELIRRLAGRGEFRLIAFVNRDGRGGEWGEEVEERLVNVRASDRKQWVYGEQVLLPRMARDAGVDLVHSLASTAPLYGDFRRVTTIHDLHYKLVAGTHFGVRGIAMRVLVPSAARRSHRVIAISASTANDLVSHLNVRRSKIDVVPQGVNQRPTVAATSEDQLRRRMQLGDSPVILTASAKRPHKNLARLIQAHAELSQPRPILVLPGYTTPHEAELKRLSVGLGTSRDLRFLSWVSAEDLEGLYALARVFVFPSLYEGFGLPPVEAMARGLPVITSNRGALAEVVGDAALIVDPESVDAILQGIRHLLADGAERDRLRTKGIARAAEFSWDRTAELTAETYRRTTQRSPDPASIPSV